MKTLDVLCSVCVTQSHEYLIYKAVCVGVRERASGEWLDEHHALDERVALLPRLVERERFSQWDLVIHTFGVRLHVGPILSVEKPDLATKDILAELVARRPHFFRAGQLEHGDASAA